MAPADKEAQWFVSLDARAKARFLASLSHALTVAGRAASYEHQAPGLTRPEFLREINEMQHHVSACLGQLLSSTPSESFERAIAHEVLEPSDNELGGHTRWAWQHAKEWVERAT